MTEEDLNVTVLPPLKVLELYLDDKYANLSEPTQTKIDNRIDDILKQLGIMTTWDHETFEKQLEDLKDWVKGLRDILNNLQRQVNRLLEALRDTKISVSISDYVYRP